MRHDLQYAIRQLRKSPGFALLVTLTIALGIGANTSIFSVINGFLRPLPVKDADEVVVIAAKTRGDETGFRYRFSIPALRDLRKDSGSFHEIFAFNTNLAGLMVDGKTAQFLHSEVTGNFFSALGLQPAAGRLFLPGEGEAPGGEALLVLGHNYWLKRFGGDPGVVGKQVRVDGKPTRIIGVAPRGFHGAYAGADMDGYAPLSAMSSRPYLASAFENRKVRPLTVLGRLKPGVSLRDAQSSMDVVARRLEEQYPATDKGIGIRVVPEYLARPLPLSFLADAVPAIRGFLLVLAGLVLLLACMNVANVLLVRATIRQRELAIRAALGSGRWRLVRQMLTESLLLAGMGATAGVVFGKWASDMFAGLIRIPTDLPVALDFGFDWRVFVYALAAAVITGIITGVLPAVRLSRTDANAVLHEGARGDSAGGGRMRLRSMMVVAQVAGSLVLLIVAGLFVRSLQDARRMDLGFDPVHVVNARIDTRYIGYDEARSRQFYRELKRRVRALPGVESASVAFSIPMGFISNGTVVFLERHTPAEDEQPPVIGVNYVDEDYFETMGIPVLRGRGIRESDTETAPRVAVINQTMASRLWPNQDPIGKRFRMDSPDRPLCEVVGVTRDSKYLAVFENPLPYLFVPSAQNFGSLRHLQVRSAMPPEMLKLQVQRAILSIEPDIPIADLRTMTESIANMPEGFLSFHLGAVQAGAMGGLGLVLAIIGVYGVVSYGASQRTREIGIRMALGAHPGDILCMILRQGVWMVGAGVSAGWAGAIAFTRLTSRFVVMVRTSDPAAFIAIPMILAVIALTACYIPAYRAMKVDPNVALRHE